MKMYQYVLGCVAGSLLMAAQGLAGAYLFEIKNYPASNQTCAQEAMALAGRLVAVANVKIDRAYCSRSTGDRVYNNLHVVYEAPQALQSIDSLDHSDMDYGIGQGIYHNLAECQYDLANQQTEFASTTGSHVVAAFCSREWADSVLPYFPVIVALVTDAEPHPRLMFVAKRIFGRAPANAQAVAQSLADQLRASGVNVRRVVLADEPADARLQISYYGTEALDIDLDHKITFENDAVCQARSAAVIAALAHAGVQLYGSFCSENEYTHSTHFYTISHAPAKEVVWTAAPGVYPNRRACEMDQGHMEEVYRAQGLAVAGSVCAYNKSYQLMLLRGN